MIRPRSLITKIVCALLLILLSAQVNAQTAYGGRACTSSVNLGKQIWDFNDVFEKDFMFCGTATAAWFSVGVMTSSAGACSAGDAGKMRWNDSTGGFGSGWYEFCDGTNWISTKGKLGTTCVNGDRKKQVWDVSTSTSRFCDGNNYYQMGPSIIKVTASNAAYVLPTYANGMIITVWGGGGGGGQQQTSGGAPQQGAAGGAGGNSTVVISTPFSLTLTSLGGLGGGGGNNTTVGAGGTGRGGSGTGATIVTGGNGVSGGNGTGDNTIGGDGGSAHKGGKFGTQGTSGPNKNKDGQSPGAGGAGATGNSKRGGGGGGASGFVSYYQSDTQLSGATVNITIGAAGVRGVSGAGNGGAGMVIITYW